MITDGMGLSLADAVCPEFDEAKYFLGSPCPQLHLWGNTGKTLRGKRKEGRSSPCIDCLTQQQAKSRIKKALKDRAKSIANGGIPPVTLFNENGFTAFDYQQYPLQAYIRYPISLESPIHVSNKVCIQGHFWGDMLHSLRWNTGSNDCYVCKRISVMNLVDSGWAKEYAAKRYAENPEKHNQQTMDSYWRHHEERLESGAQQRASRREKIKSGVVEPFYHGKPCRKCGETLRYSICSDCVRCAKERAESWRLANPERVRELHLAWNEANQEKINKSRKKWIENNPDKHREVQNRGTETKKNAHSVPFTPEQLFAHLTAFDFCCGYCGEALQLDKKRGWAMDHFIPKSKGGSNSLSNYVPSCNRCNHKKIDKDAWEWYSRYTHFSKSRWRKILKILGKTQANYQQIPLL